MLDRIRRAYDMLNGKALHDQHPELRYRERVSSSWTNADYTTMAIDNYVGAAQTYKVYLWVRKACSLIVNNLSPLPVEVLGSDGKALGDHPAALALRTANPSADPARLWTDYFIYKLLGGEAFLEEVTDARGRPAELWARRPDYVTIIPGDDAGYPTVIGYAVAMITDPIPAIYMVHDMFPNPMSRWRGLGIPSALANSINIDTTAQAADLAFFQKSARPDFVVTTTEAQTPDERARLELEIESKFSGPGGWHKPAVLENGQGIEVLSFPPKDVMALEQRQMARDEVAAGFGVPDILMGFGNDSYDTEEKRKGAESALWTLTLLPLVQRRDQVLTWHWRRRGVLRPDERIATDLTGVAVLQEDIAPKLEAAGKFWSLGVPYNVIEDRLQLGTGPIPSGAIGYLPTSVMPADMVALPQPSGPLGAAVTRSGATTRATAQQSAQALRRIKLEAARRMEPEIAAALADLSETVVGRARKAIGADTFKANGATTLTATVVKDLPSLDELIGLRDLDPVRLIIERYAVDVCRASWETWNSGLFVDVLFDRADPAVVAAVAQGGDRIVDILNTTRDAIRRTLEWATENSLSLSQFVNGDGERPGLAQIVEQTYANRARTIARTELAFAQNVATFTRFESVGVTRVEVFDNGVEDSDPRCTELNGTIQTLAWARANPLQHPNCLRTFAPVLD